MKLDVSSYDRLLILGSKKKMLLVEGLLCVEEALSKWVVVPVLA